MKKSSLFATKIFSILAICSFTFISCNNTDKINNNEFSNISLDITQSPSTEATPSQSFSHTFQNEDSIKSFDFDETQITILNENDYADAEIISETDVLLLYKPVVNISDAYPDMNYQYVKFPDDFNPHAVDDHGTWYDSIEIDEAWKIISYVPESGNTEVIIEANGKDVCAVLCIKDNYLVWAEDEDNYWRSPSYHVYNLDTMNDTLFYESAINPETDSAYYSLHFNEPVIIQDKIYFDDIINMDENKFPHKIVYFYDIINENLEVLYDNAMWPLEYNGQIAWFSLSEDEKHGVLCNQTCTLFKMTSLLGSNACSCKEIIAVHDNISENTFTKLSKGEHIDTDIDPQTELSEDDTLTTSHGIKLFRNGNAEPLLLSGNNSVAYATNVSTNGRFVCWIGENIGIPMFYDAVTDSIIKVDFLENQDIDTYSFMFYNNDLILNYSSYADCSDIKHILIRLQ